MRFVISFLVILWGGFGFVDEYQESTWRILGTVQFEKQYDETVGFEIDVPRFGPWITALEGKEIQVSGYIIPLEGKRAQSYFMFSALPYELCFFCGKAGPETAMEVYIKDGNTLKYHPERITLSGTLELNRKPSLQPIYTLRNAKKIEE